MILLDLENEIKKHKSYHITVLPVNFSILLKTLPGNVHWQWCGQLCPGPGPGTVTTHWCTGDHGVCCCYVRMDGTFTFTNVVIYCSELNCCT